MKKKKKRVERSAAEPRMDKRRVRLRHRPWNRLESIYVYI